MMLAISRNKDPKASAPYLSLLKLSRPPFADQAGEDFYYADPERAQYLDMLQHLAQYSDELLLVTGPGGSGKTALLERFLERAEEHWRTCRLEGAERLDADKLFAQIARCFELSLETAGENLLAGLQSQLNALQEQQLPVLIIDDAEGLSDDALEIIMHLAALEGENGKLIRVILFADSTLEQRLAEARFSEMPAPHRITINPFDETHTAAYLTHRLQAAGYQGDPLFTARELAQLQRDSGGYPGALNEAAHSKLLERLSKGRSTAGSRRWLQVGLAASAVIGTVIGLHEKINAVLSGEPQVMSVTAPERPVIRSAEAGNPWAVVIRDGESVQINCGAPTGATVGVRPVMMAAAEQVEIMPLSKPMMRDVTPAAQDEAEPEETSISPETELPEDGQVPDKVGELAAAAPEGESPTEPSQEETQPVAEEAESAEVPAQEPVPATVESPAQSPAELKLTGVEPSPVPVGGEPRRVVLKGSGFEPGSKVAVSHGGKVAVLPSESVEYIDSQQLAMKITPGEKAEGWAVQVSTPDKQRSNVLRFRVEPVAEVQAMAGEQAKPETLPDEPPAETKPAVAAVEKTAMQEPDTASTKRPGPVKEGAIKDQQWLARQPSGNYTLQLLASESREGVEAFADEHSLPAPVARFAMKKNGKTLHALVQGSYSSRAAAEQAASRLPTELKPWLRSIGSVQQVMLRTVAGKPGSKPSGDGAATKDTAWVWSQDPNRFTVQLAAASNEAALEVEMRRTGLPGELAVVQTVRNGKPWYALIYGSFASKEAARGTITRLPPALQKDGPWPRSFASLQDEISRSTPAQ